MSYNINPEQSPDRETDLPETIIAGGVRVTFAHPESIKKRLADPNEIIELLVLDSDDLPEPCTESSLIYRYVPGDVTPEVHLAGQLEFDAPNDGNNPRSWQIPLLHHIKRSLSQHDIDTACSATINQLFMRSLMIHGPRSCHSLKARIPTTLRCA
jgi:hypothetical protein